MTTGVEPKDEVSLWQKCLWVLNTIFHQAVAVVTVFILWVYFKNCDLDCPILWHVVLSAGAYVPLMSEGIILFSGDNVWSLGSSRSSKYWMHGVLLGISIAAVTAGIAVEIHHKRNEGADHFVSDHAITGLVSWLLAFLSIFLGLFSWHSPKLRAVARPVMFKFIHNFIGIACYAIGIASLCLGFYLMAFTHLVAETEQKAMLGVVIIITVWSLLAAFKSGYNQLKDIFS